MLKAAVKTLIHNSWGDAVVAEQQGLAYRIMPQPVGILHNAVMWQSQCVSATGHFRSACQSLVVLVLVLVVVVGGGGGMLSPHSCLSPSLFLVIPDLNTGFRSWWDGATLGLRLKTSPMDGQWSKGGIPKWWMMRRETQPGVDDPSLYLDNPEMSAKKKKVWNSG